MKFVVVLFPDPTDTSALPPGAVVAVGSVPGGTIAVVGTMQNPGETVLTPHDHPTAETKGLVTIPAGTTGPATPTP